MVLLLAQSFVFAANPSTKSFRAAGGLTVTSNDITGIITYDGSGVFSSGTNSTIRISTNAFAVTVAATNLNFTPGNNAVLKGTNIDSTAHINIGIASNLTFNSGSATLVLGTWGDVFGISNAATGNLSMWLDEPDIHNEWLFQDSINVGGVVVATNVQLTAILGTGTNVGITAGGQLFRMSVTGGSGTPGGVDQSIQFNTNGAFGGDTSLQYQYPVGGGDPSSGKIRINISGKTNTMDANGFGTDTAHDVWLKTGGAAKWYLKSAGHLEPAVSNSVNVGTRLLPTATNFFMAMQMHPAAGVGKVLTSDANGFGTWQTASGGGGTVSAGQSVSVVTNGSDYEVAVGLKDLLMSDTNRLTFSNGVGFAVSPDGITNNALYFTDTNGLHPQLIWTTATDGSFNGVGFQANPDFATFLDVVTTYSGTSLGTLRMRGITLTNAAEVGKVWTATSTDGSGAWSNAPSGSGTPGGSTYSVQWNNAGAFAGDTALQYHPIEFYGEAFGPVLGVGLAGGSTNLMDPYGFTVLGENDMAFRTPGPTDTRWKISSLTGAFMPAASNAVNIGSRLIPTATNFMMAFQMHPGARRNLQLRSDDNGFGSWGVPQAGGNGNIAGGAESPVGGIQFGQTNVAGLHMMLDSTNNFVYWRNINEVAVTNTGGTSNTVIGAGYIRTQLLQADNFNVNTLVVTNGIPAAGSNFEIQYNASGILGASANFRYLSSSSQFQIKNPSASAEVDIDGEGYIYQANGGKGLALGLGGLTNLMIDLDSLVLVRPKPGIGTNIFQVEYTNKVPIVFVDSNGVLHAQSISMPSLERQRQISNVEQLSKYLLDVPLIFSNTWINFATAGYKKVTWTRDWKHAWIEGFIASSADNPPAGGMAYVPWGYRSDGGYVGGPYNHHNGTAPVANSWSMFGRMFYNVIAWVATAANGQAPLNASYTSTAHFVAIAHPTDTDVCLLIPPNCTNATTLVVYFHAGMETNAATINFRDEDAVGFGSNWVTTVKGFLTNGWPVLSHRAGETDTLRGWSSPASIANYSNSVVWATNSLIVTNVVFMASSMGGAPALRLFADMPSVTKLYLASAITSLSNSYYYIDAAFSNSLNVAFSTSAASFAADTAAYDPLRLATNLYGGRLVRLAASSSDTIVVPSYHAQQWTNKFYTASYSTTNTTGAHASAGNIIPADIIAFFKQ